MSYMHIENLPKLQNLIFQFKEVYAMEKIHGTSAHVCYKRERTPNLSFFAGGSTHTTFVNFFDQEKLLANFDALGHDEVTVYGEAYGGKCQGMSATYGKELKFVAFEVKVGEVWLNVANAKDVCDKLGIEFVAFEKVPCTEEALTFERDRPSRQAIRNGIEEIKPAEGIVIRPLLEFQINGHRIIAKFKREDFSERKSKADTILDPNVAVERENAKGIAEEWVTPERLRHVMDRVRAEKGVELDRTHTPDIIKAMEEDVMREGAEEFAKFDNPSSEFKSVQKAIRAETGRLFGTFVNQIKTDLALNPG